MPSSLLQERLEGEFLESLGLISTAATLMQRERRAATQAQFAQRKYNLLREESEGYAKLIAELNGSIDGISNSSSEADLLVERLKSLIGTYLCVVLCHDGAQISIYVQLAFQICPHLRDLRLL